MKALHIALLVKHFHLLGGSERYAYEICRRMVARGHSLDLFAWEADRDLLHGITFHQVRDPFPFSSAGRLFLYARQVAKILPSMRHDIIHSHEKGFYQDIFTQHSFTYKEGMRKYSWLRRFDQIYLSLRSQIYLWLEKKQMQSLWLVPVSTAIQEDISRNYARKDNLCVISPGVDIDHFSPAWVAENRDIQRRAANIAEDEFVVLFVGSEFKRKGLDHLIPAIKYKMQLLVVGRGNHLPYYQKLAASHGVNRQVHFIGLCQDVRNYYAMADVVVLPSLSEAFGMSILEAMACGLPIIVTANSGVAELVVDGKNGFLLREFPQLSEVMHYLRSSPDVRRQVGAAARKTAETHTWDRATEAYEKLYYRVYDEKKRAWQRGG